MAAPVSFLLNGEPHSLADVSPNTTLLDYLRAKGLTGSKEGCAEGDCGACSVAVIHQNPDGTSSYRSVNSCLMPVCLLAGREVISVEGVGCSADLHPVQRKMVDCLGSQCGYCTPGFICSMFEGFYRDDLKTHDDLDDQLSGNLCRCTGYRPIRDAAIEAFAERHSKNGTDPFADQLKKTDATLHSANYELNGEKFFRPTSLIELLDLVRQNPDARLIAGATELGLDITKRYKKFSTLISVEAVAELRKLEAAPDEWRIGAAVTLTEIEDQLAEEFPALGDMLRVFGSRQIRNRATMGGNVVTASPIGDSAPVLLAVDAKVVLASRTQERTLPISEFFLSYRKTALQPGEVLKTIVIPSLGVPAGQTRKSAWFKVSKRREMDISTVAACIVVDLDAQNVVRYARLGYGGVAAMPVRAQKTEAALLGKTWNDQTLREVLPILATEFTPISDVRGSVEYRRGLITSLLEKFFYQSSSSIRGVADHASRVELVNRTNAKSSPSLTRSGGEGRGEEVLRSSGFNDGEQSFAKPKIPHESAHKHVSGEALYTDDQPAGKNFLEVWPVCSPHARAKILKRDATAARQMPGIRAVLLAEDVPGRNDVGPVIPDEILLADKEVSFHGHLVALVVGETQEACRAAAEKVLVEYEPLPPVLTLHDAVAKESFHNQPNFMRRGEIDKSLAAAPLKLHGEFEFGGQEHFYLETQAAWAEPGEDDSMLVTSSTQHPSEVQMAVAHVLHQPVNKVVVQSPRMGGGFGGKETQAATPAALAALAAHHTGRPVRVRFNRDQDMALTGHRHPFLAKFEVGYDDRGLLRAAKIHFWSNGGWSLDLSQAVTDRALFHADNAYYIPAVEFRGQVAKTNLSSNTAFRGFGGPQGMLVIEEIIDRIARRLGLPPEVVRERNLYHGKGETNTTHYGQEIEDNRIQTVWQELKKNAALEQRRADLAKWNAAHPHQKRGLALTPVKFGISFTVTHMNQAGAFVLIYQDGTIQVNHGGTEMGQGLHTNVAMIAAQTLGVKFADIRVMQTSTDKVPNTSATAASCGTDLNGAAVKNACEILRARLTPVALKLLQDAAIATTASKQSATSKHSPLAPIGGLEPLGKRRKEFGEAEGPERAERAGASESLGQGEGAGLTFADGFVSHRDLSDVRLPFAKVVQKAYTSRVSLSTTGFYATPNIHWDRAAGRGKPFHYFANGAAVTEVEVDGFTGMHRVLRVDILHDVGDSINEGVNRGQIEGGFVQGMGWLTAEELKWDDKGRLLTHSPDTYKIPSVGDTPEIFNVTLLKNATQKTVVHGSKAVGEPPLMLAISVREALRDAVAAFGSANAEVPLASPATCEAIWRAIQQRRNNDPQFAKSKELAMPVSQ